MNSRHSLTFRGQARNPSKKRRNEGRKRGKACHGGDQRGGRGKDGVANGSRGDGREKTTRRPRGGGNLGGVLMLDDNR